MKRGESDRLIKEAQGGCAVAMNSLLSHIKSHYMSSVINKYRDRNIVIDNDELESRFLEGCWRGVGNAVLDKGNPFMYVLQRGRWALRTYRYHEMKRHIHYCCDHCGHTSSLTKSNVCKMCNNTVINLMTIDHQEDHETLPIRKSTIDTDWEDERDMERFIALMQAPLSGRVLELFDMIVVHGYDRSNCKNYIKDIAEEWEITPSCVSIYLRKLRAQLDEFKSELKVA